MRDSNHMDRFQTSIIAITAFFGVLATATFAAERFSVFTPYAQKPPVESFFYERGLIVGETSAPSTEAIP